MLLFATYPDRKQRRERGKVWCKNCQPEQADGQLFCTPCECPAECYSCYHHPTIMSIAILPIFLRSPMPSQPFRERHTYNICTLPTITRMKGRAISSNWTTLEATAGCNIPVAGLAAAPQVTRTAGITFCEPLCTLDGIQRKWRKHHFATTLLWLSLTLWVYSGSTLFSAVPPTSIHKIFKMIIAVAVLLHPFISVSWRPRTRAKQG